MQQQLEPGAGSTADRPSSLVYFCRCLNVQLHRRQPTPGGDGESQKQKTTTTTTTTTTTNRPNAQDDDDDDGDPNLNYGDPFFSNAVSVETTSPDDEFVVSKRVDCLCCTRAVADKWVVTSCLNCRIDTHAIELESSSSMLERDTHVQDDPDGHRRRRLSGRIFVSRKMNTDVSKASSLSQSEDLSRVFNGIIVRPFVSNEDQSIGLFVDRRQTDNRCQQLQSMASAFLDAERESTKQRISEYKKVQLTNLKQLESRVHQDRNILLQRMPTSVVQDGGGGGGGAQSNNQLGEAPGGKPSTIDVLSGGTFVTSATSGESDRDHRSTTAKIDAPIAGRIKTITSSDVFAMDEDDVFTSSTDGDDNDEEDDDDDDDDDECPSDDAPRARRTSADRGLRLFATSLPVSMPVAPWKGSSSSSGRPVVVVGSARRLLEEDAAENVSSSDKDNFKTDDPEWMAASIKALAMSVRGDDTTDLFGARPRPRLNTLD